MEWLWMPRDFILEQDRIILISHPFTDLWQKTYYHFINNNAPALLMESRKESFTFQVRTQFKGKQRFDQCGILLWIDDENWIKASAEYHDKHTSQLGSVVTQYGYSDWASMDISGEQESIWYRLSRRQSDWRIETSFDGVSWQQIRVCHMFKNPETVRFGIYVASPEDSSFQAEFSQAELLECLWPVHDGQPPDEGV